MAPRVGAAGETVPATSAAEPHGVVIHRMRSSITAISGYAQMLVHGLDSGTLPPDKLRDRLERIRHAAEQLNTQLDDLRAQARAAPPIGGTSRGLAPLIDSRTVRAASGPSSV